MQYITGNDVANILLHVPVPILFLPATLHIINNIAYSQQALQLVGRHITQYHNVCARQSVARRPIPMTQSCKLARAQYSLRSQISLVFPHSLPHLLHMSVIAELFITVLGNMQCEFLASIYILSNSSRTGAVFNWL